MRGTVVRKTDRGFGFITGEDGRDYFFHVSQLANRTWDTIDKGDPVEFDSEFNKRRGKEHAVDVRVI